ncbi:MAG TPA: FecR domain-containing protein [Puia sp.]|nr:FecR domain-containing protein [Puia sp.]
MRKVIVLLSVTLAACQSGTNVRVGDGTKYVNNSGGMKWVALPDSSRVRIADGTTIVVGPAYSKGSRSVDLDGEGMFEVRVIGGDRFVVTTRNLFIQGTGTKFLVDAPHSRPGEEVDLLDGLLVVRKMYHSDLDSAQEILRSGDMLMINREIDLMEKEKMSPQEVQKAEAKFGKAGL